MLTLSSFLLSEDLKFSFDRKGNREEVSRFRTTKDELKKVSRSHKISYQGLAELHASASGQLSEKEIRQLKKRVAPQRPLVLADLRGSFHGYINGQPMRWDRKDQKVNIHNVINVEKEVIASLLSQRKLTIRDRTKTHDLVVAVKTAATESELASKYNLEYARFPVESGSIPADNVIDAFVKFVTKLDPETHIHLHCLEGSSRATTVFIMLDMLRNADKATFQDIGKRHEILGGAALLEKSKYSRHQKFLKDFHAYSRARFNGLKAPWSTFKKRRNLP
jgi:protein tyrosine phosphatase (PTP) superfamily phosphohydrolase (DUF442 family)